MVLKPTQNSLTWVVLGGQWTASIFATSNVARTMDPIATLTTGLDTGCRFCINPNHPTAAFFSVDSVTHCVGKLVDHLV